MNKTTFQLSVAVVFALLQGSTSRIRRAATAMNIVIQFTAPRSAITLIVWLLSAALFPSSALCEDVSKPPLTPIEERLLHVLANEKGFSSFDAIWPDDAALENQRVPLDKINPRVIQDVLNWMQEIIRKEFLPESLKDDLIAIKDLKKRGYSHGDYFVVQVKQGKQVLAIQDSYLALGLLVTGIEPMDPKESPEAFLKKCILNYLNFPKEKLEHAFIKLKTERSLIYGDVYCDWYDEKLSEDKRWNWLTERYRHWWQNLEVCTDGKYFFVRVGKVSESRRIVSRVHPGVPPRFYVDNLVLRGNVLRVRWPKEYALFCQVHASDGPNPLAAEAALVILGEARKSLDAALDAASNLQEATREDDNPYVQLLRQHWEPNPKIDELIKAAHAHQVAWEICLRIWKETEDAQVKKRIMDEWNQSLDGNENRVRSQIEALEYEWDRTLLTDDFWRLFQNTKSMKTTTNICALLRDKCHSESDIAKLKDKLASVTDKDTRNTLEDAIWWIKYYMALDKLCDRQIQTVKVPRYQW